MPALSRQRVKTRSGRMHVDQAGRHYTTADGERRSYPTYLLHRSYRDEQGRPRKETLANLTGLPPESIEALRATLRGRTLVDAQAAFEAQRSVPHGDVAAAHVMASALGLRALLGPACAERDLAYALVLSRAVRPRPKLATARWWAGGDTTLGADLAVAGAGTDEIYAAMDWLTARQGEIERQLAARHLREGGIAMFDLSSSWVEGSCCELAAFGHSRDGKLGRRQVVYGLLTDAGGRPVAVEVFAGKGGALSPRHTVITAEDARMRALPRSARCFGVLQDYGSVPRTSLCGHSWPRTRESTWSELLTQYGVCSGSFTAKVTGAASSPHGGIELASAPSSRRSSYSGCHHTRKARCKSPGRTPTHTP